jgi:hypothetical protein
MKTVIVAVKCLPVTVTVVPPTRGPFAGVIEVTEGFTKYLKLFDAVVPPALETESAFVPAVAHTGIVKVKVSAVGFVVVSEENERSDPHSVTVIVAVKFLPVTVTVAGPVAGPFAGESDVTMGFAK